MGTGDICLPTLRWLLGNSDRHPVVGVFTQPDKPIGRKQILTAPEVKTLAQEAGIPVFQPETLRKNEEALENLRALAPDLVVVMAYGQILPRSVIDASTLATVNLHASLLPRHRGASPIQAAIREGDAETGITLMHVAPKLDSGDMILKETIPITPEETGGILHDKLADLGPITIQRGIEHFEKSSAQAEPQDEDLVTHCGKLGRDDGQIDWTRDADTIERLVRAYDPWPGTYTTLSSGGKCLKWKIFPPVEIGSYIDAPPGSALAEKDGITVACGTGSVLLRGDVQLEGRKRMPISDLLRGFDLPQGTVFGKR